MPVVYVYTGGSFTAVPSYAVDTSGTVGVEYHTTSAGALVVATGTVTYFVTLKTGKLQLPANNRLDLSFDRDGVTVVDNKCTSSSDVFLLGTTLDKAVPADTDLTCLFTVSANSTDQDAAHIAPFTVTATFSGDDTTHNEYFVPSIMTPVVPVYTGGQLAAPTSEVVNLDGSSTSSNDGSWYTAVDGQPLVKVNGHVKYTVAFTAGTSPYPSDTTFTLNLGTLTAVAGTTKCTAGAVTITPGAPISDTSVIYGKDWTCSFEVQVLESHRLAGQISPFDVTMVFSTSDPLVNAFYIPKTTTEVVYVYTGATLSYGSFAVDKTNSAYFSTNTFDLVKADGKITYTATFSTGGKAIGADNTVEFIFGRPDVTVVGCKTAADAAVAVSPSNLSSGLAANTVVTCTFSATATSTEQADARIAAFDVTSRITGTETREFFVPVSTTVDVPVWTGGVMDSPLGTVVAAANTYYAVPSGDLLIRQGGQIQYTFAMTTGTDDIPSGATLQLTTPVGITPLNPACTSTSPTGLTLTPGANTPSAAVSDSAARAHLVEWNCTFSVGVDVGQATAGQIVPFAVGLEWGSVTVAYYIDPENTGDVLVHTGSQMALQTPMVDVTTDKHIDAHGIPLVIEGGKVKYPFTITNGLKAVPASSQLHITVDGVTPIANSLTCKLAGAAFTLASPWGSNPLAPTSTLDCVFEVLVLDEWTVTGQIPEILVTPTFTPGDTLTPDIYYLEPKIYAPVLVYTNGIMGYVANTTITTAKNPAVNNETYFEGADGGQPLVKSGGTVQYKVTIVTGNRTIPAGNHLSITTGTGVVVSPCQAGDVDVSIGGVAIPADIPPQTAITCTIEVAVDNTHKAAGEVAPFILTAALGGPNITSAFFIPRITTPSVAVYTGGELSTLDSQVVLADGSYYQVLGTPLVKDAGTVRYTFQFHQGAKALPPGSILSVIVLPQVAKTAPVCVSGSDIITSGAAIPTGALTQGLTFDCTLDITVTDAHRAAGQNPSFDLELKYSGSGVTNAYFIPKIASAPVYVYTGAELLYKTYEVDIQDDNTYFTLDDAPTAPDLHPVDYSNLVKSGGKVKYTVTLSTGYKDVTVGNQLDILTSIGVVPSEPCSLDDGGGDISLGVALGSDQPLGSDTIPSNQQLTCSFEVHVTDTHQLQGEIAPFTVTANYSGPDTWTREYFVPSVVTTSVPVYTGTTLEAPTSQVVEVVNSYYSVSNVDLVKAGGSVKYTVIFHTGTSPILSGTTLSLTTSSSLAPPTPDISNPLSATCIGHDAGNNAVTMTPDGITTIPTASLAANITWTCTFDIAVTNNHRDAGEVGVFDVVYKYNVPGVTTAFHIPAVQTEAVPVYTAGVLSDAGHVVNTDGADGTFIQSVANVADGNLVNASGTVTFSVSLSTGYKEVPTNNQLAILTDVPGLTVAGPCKLLSDGSDVPLNQALTLAIPAGSTITCPLPVVVTGAHQAIAMIAPFQVTAVWSGSDTLAGEYYVPSITTHAVPVYTGSELQVPETQVNLDVPAATYYNATTALDSTAVPLVKQGGSVKYTVHFVTGKAPIPSRSTLHLTTTSAQSGGITPISSTTHCSAFDGSSNPISMTPGSIIPAGSSGANIDWTCTFDVLVTAVHKAAGQIDPFDVEFSITGSADVTAAYHVPKTTTLPVHVYSGVAFNTPVASAVDDNLDTFFALTPNNLVKKDGSVTYTFVIRTGAKALPASVNYLDITTDPYGPVTGPCTMVTTGDIVLGSSQALPAIPANKDIMCTFTVTVTQDHQDAAQIAPFTISAMFSGPDTETREFHVPDIQTLSVPVYTGGSLEEPTSQVLTATAGSYYNDPDVTMGDLVKKGGIVEYTVHFTSGTSPVPSGSRLTFTSGVTPSNVPSCTSTAGNIIVGSAIPDAILLEVSTLAIPLIWTCMFQVTVNQVQQDAGEIAPFDVQFSYTAGVAWYIPKTTTISVPVWTGAKLTYTRWDTMQTTDLFYPLTVGALVKQDGQVTYTVTINTGTKQLPANNQLDLNTSIGVIPAGPCTALGGPIPLASATLPLLPANTNIVCTFNVTADNTHKLAGEIAPFSVRAAFSGTDTSTGEYYVAGTDVDSNTPTTPSVPVYTGGVLTAPVDQVVQTDATTFYTVNGGPLVKQGGFVEYSVTFTNGIKAVPLNSVLTVTLSGGLTPINPTCTSDALTITANTNTQISDAAALAADLPWNCTFRVLVSADQKATGQIAPFDVKFAYTGTAAVTDAYFVPKVTTQSVQVYTGGTLAYVSNVADTTDPTAFVDVNNVPMAKEGGMVIYTATLINGAKAVPSGSTLTFSATGSNTPINAACTSSAGSIPVGTAITNSTKLAANLMITCTVEVVVSGPQRLAGQIDAFDLIANYSGPGITTDAYHVPATVTTNVLVYQNIPMLLISSALTSSDATLYKTVNGVKAAKAGAEITYTVIVISGNSSVPATSKLFIPVTATGLSIPEAITNCKTGANTTNIPLQATLAAQTALVCHFKYIVTPDMVADGQLPSLSIVPQTMVASYAYDYVAAAQIIQVGPGFPSYPAAALPVPVYTAPALTASSAVDPAATTTYTTVDGFNMPKSTATVIYTLTLINGDLAVPSGSKFMLNMANTISYTGLGCNGGGAIIPGTAVTYAAALAVRGVITCTFNVPVTAAHVTAGKIPEFTVSAQWTNNAGVALDDAYTIPQLTVASVPVVTGQPTLLPVKYTVAGSSLVSVRGVNYAQANDGVTYTVLLLNGGSSVTEASNLTLQVTSSDAAYPSTINTSCTPSLPLANGDTIAAAGVLRCAFTVIVQPSHVLARQMPSFRVKAVTGTTNRTTYAVQVVAPAVPLYTNPMLSVYPEVSGIESITYQIVNKTNKLAAVNGMVSFRFKLANGPVDVPPTISINLVSNSSVDRIFTSCTVNGASKSLPIDGLAPFGSLDCIISHPVTQQDVNVGNLYAYGVQAMRYPKYVADGETLEYAAVGVDPLPLFTGLPCIQCRSCLAGMFAIASPLLAETDAGRIASLFNTECRKTRNGALCDAITAQIQASPLGNKGKRAGYLCKQLKECEPDLFEGSCSLLSATIPHGAVNVCLPQGTSAGYITMPYVVKQGTPLDTGYCTSNSQCPSTQMCANSTDPTVTPFTRCVCDALTGEDTCEHYYSCADTPCTKCRKCFATARDFTATVKSEVLATNVADAFKAFCVKSNTLDLCTKLAVDIAASYQGNLGKRPGWICRALGGCPDSSTLPADCVIGTNRTANESTIMPATYSMCTVDGRAEGLLAAGMYRNSSSPKPTGSCDASAGCNTTNGEVCSYNAGLQFCVCNEADGTDSCSDLGMCQAITCADCNKCINATIPWITARLNVTNATAVATAWVAHCTGTLKKSAAACDVAKNAILTSKNGNIGKRAATLCSFVYACSTAPGTTAASCKVNATNTLANSSMPLLVNKAINLCNIEGVNYGNPVPGVVSSYTDTPKLPSTPVGKCTVANPTCDDGYKCDFGGINGGACTCNLNDGSDACVDYYSCIRTPCKICSDCLTDMTVFAKQQMFTLDKGPIVFAFTPYCTKNWTTDQCATAMTKFTETTTPLNFGKRAGSICTTMGVCEPSLIGGSCVVKPLPTNSTFQGTTADLDMCTIEGIKTGSNILGTTNALTVPAGRCDNDLDCGSSDKYCSKTSTTSASFCTCYAGQDSCRDVGTCLLKPCPACQACLTAFQPFVNGIPSNASTPSALAASFYTACRSANRPAQACEAASLAVESSYQGNMAKRAGGICSVLGECVASTLGTCNLTDATSYGIFSLCTSSGISAGTPLTGFPISSYTPTAAKCLSTSNCNSSIGEECTFKAPTVGCFCSEVTGLDSCAAVGDCAVAPCKKCQTCLDLLNPVITRERNKTTPVTTAACQDATYPACTALKANYVSATGVSGFFGLRAGAQCAALQQCTDLPASCTLRAQVGAVNKSANLDLCAAEGIVGGSPVGQGVPAGACLKDADCAADQQCDLSSTVTVWKCSSGLDTATPYGTCVAKPTPQPQLSSCERCSACIGILRQTVEAAAVNASAAPSFLAQKFYTACSSANYSLTACREVQTAVSSSYAGNLARRTGALCARLGECSNSLSTDSSCVLSTHGSTATSPAAAAGSNDTAVAVAIQGVLDTCTIEGVSSGSGVQSTYKVGQAVNNTCVLDSDCSSSMICGSSSKLQICRCMNGIDSCDALSTCQIPAVIAPVVYKTPCQKCSECLNMVAAYVADTATDPAVLAARFITNCTKNYTDDDELMCKQTSDAVMYNIRLAKRAGALCSRLGACSSDLAADSSCNMTVGTKAGRLNLCEKAGVGNTATSAVVYNSSYCRSDTDCYSGTIYSGKVCSLADNKTTVQCTCTNGNDTCVRVGTCVSFCSTQQAYLDSVNAAVAGIACSGPYADCGVGMRCKASSQCNKLACDAVKGITTIPCYGFCMAADRKVMGARMSDDGNTILVVLNTAAATSSFACAALFDSAAMAKLGYGAWCTATDKQLTIQLGAQSTFMPEADKLNVLANQSVLYDILDTTATFQGVGLPVALCSACMAPTAVILGPKAVPAPCDASTSADVIFDASFSKDSSVRPLARVAWSQVPATGASSDVALATAVDKANTANNGTGSYRLTIPATQLCNMQGTSYTIRVTVTSLLGISNTADWTFSRKSSGSTPVITFLSGSEVPFKIAEGVKVAVQLVADSVCSGKQVEYLWQPVSPNTWSAMPTAYKKKDLVLPGPVPGVTNGQRITVQLTANFVGGVDKTQVNVTLVAAGSQLVAKLKGPSGDIKSDRDIILNAAGSYDPDDPQGTRPLSVVWECIRADYPAPCFTGANNTGNRTGLTWSLNAKLLAPGLEHVFKATVKRTNADNSVDESSAATASVTFTPKAAAIPSGRIRRVCSTDACPELHSTDSALIVTMALDAASEGAAITWGSVQVPELGNVTGKDFVIPASMLPKTTAITISATLDSGSATSTTSVTIPINGKPTCTRAAGCITVDVTSGAYPAKFTAEAVGFVDDQPDLRYTFGVLGDSNVRIIMSTGPSPTYTFTGLKPGDRWLFVCAVDSSKAQECSKTMVTVQEPAADFKISDKLSAIDVSQMAGTGDISILAAGAQMLEGLFKMANKSDGVAARTAEQQQEIQNVLIVKTSSMINTLASSAGDYINDPENMQQIVSAVFTLTKATNQLSKDAKQQMKSVIESGISSALLNKKPTSPAEASRMFAVAAAANSIKALCTQAGFKCGQSASTTKRLLLEATESSVVQLQQQQQQEGYSWSPASTLNRRRSVLQDNNSTATDVSAIMSSTRAADIAAKYFVPGFFHLANEISDLLCKSATPATGYLSGGDNGLFVSVANHFGRNYHTAQLAAGPQLDDTGNQAAPNSGDNVHIKFNQDLVGTCVDEEGVQLSSGTCGDVIVPVKLTYTADIDAMLSTAAAAAAPATASKRKLQQSSTLPSGWQVVSGAATLEVLGSTADPFPCDGCTATVTIPLWESAQEYTLYHCAQIVDGVITLDAATASSKGTTAVGSVAAVQCEVNKAGSYVVGMSPDPNRPQGATEVPAEVAAAAVLGQPLFFTFHFETAANFSVDAFLANSSQVEAFRSSTQSELVYAFTAQNLAASFIDNQVTVSNIRKGSIVFDAEVDTTSITDVTVLTSLATAIVTQPQTFFRQSFLDAYSVLNVTAVINQAPAAAAAAVNKVPAIVGGVVGGVGGLIVIALVTLVVLRRSRRRGVIEPRTTDEHVVEATVQSVSAKVKPKWPGFRGSIDGSAGSFVSTRASAGLAE